MRFTDAISSRLLATLFCAGFVATTEAQPVMLTSEGIRDTLAGNTLSDGASWAEYYWSNGIIARKSYRGEWSTQDGRVCFDYAGTRYDGCYAMSLEGTQAVLHSHDKPQRVLKLIKGNPENLTPAHGNGQINKTFFGGVAIEGYDPVAYFTQGRPMKGSPELAYEWLGATWHFANAEHREAFAATPHKYMPQFGGYCAAAMSLGFVKSLDPEAWRIVDGKLYVYASKQGRDRDAQHIAEANANWQSIKAGLSP